MWTPGWEGCCLGPPAPDSRAGSCSCSGAPGQVKKCQLRTVFFSHSLKGEASRYIFLTKFRKFLQENASGRGVGIGVPQGGHCGPQGGHCGPQAVLQGYTLGIWHLSAACLSYFIITAFSSRVLGHSLG